jgi:hypothetical protein
MKNIFWIFLATIFCAVAVYWVWFSDGGDLRQETMDTSGGAPWLNADLPDQEPEAALNMPVVAPAPPIIVDSYASSELGLLDEWNQLNFEQGHFDLFKRHRDGADVKEATSLEPTDILVAQGWAGIGYVGLRFQDVVLSACGQIIARAQVEQPRSDIAKIIHPNLGKSGWRARVLAQDLPFCSDSKLRGWAILPGAQPALFPLINEFPYVSTEVVELPQRQSAQKAVSPLSYPKPRFVTVKVNASKANLRSCGSASCGVIEKIERGNHKAHIGSRGPEWSLVLFAGKGGWLFNDLYEVVP